MLKNNVSFTNDECLNTATLRKFEYVKVLSSPYDLVSYVLAVHPKKSFFIYQHGKHLKRKTLVSVQRNFKLITKLLMSDSYEQTIYLQFFQKTNQFISGQRNNFKIWTCQAAQNFWTCMTIYDEEVYKLLTFTINKDENLIISGGDDCKVKFWSKGKNWKCQQSIKAHRCEVLQVCLSESGKKLISLGDESIISVMENQENSFWQIVQKINVRYGHRLHFISDTLFTYQIISKSILETYKFDEISYEFKKSLDVNLMNGRPRLHLFNSDCLLFPQQLIKSKGIIVSKLGYCVNILLYENGVFKTVQAIPFQTINIFGTLSDDGEILLITDEISQSIQIFKCIIK